MTSPKQADELLPCPFCSEKNDGEELHYNGSGPPPSFQLCCGSCGSRGPFGYGKERGDEYHAKRDAYAKWNQRARLSSPSVPEGWRKAVAHLVFMGRTSGGTAGRDNGLCNALDAVEALLAKPAAAIDADKLDAWIGSVDGAIGNFEEHLEQCDIHGLQGQSFREDIENLKELSEYLLCMDQPPSAPPEAGKVQHCPTCNSHNPKLHPAMQFEGEVQICADPYHKSAYAEPPSAQGEADDERVRKELACVIVERLWGINNTSGMEWRRAVEDVLRINNYPNRPAPPKPTAREGGGL